MALTAGSVQLIGIRAASGLGAGSYPSPFTMYGLLDNADGTQTQYVSGDVLAADTARGTLAAIASAGAGSALASITGVLTPVAPPRAFKAPLTAVATPATALSNTFTVPATNNGQNYSVAEDPTFGCLYYPVMPGNIFASHVCSEADTAGNAGTDVRADSDVDIWDLYGVTIAQPSGAGAGEVNYGSLNIRQYILAQDEVGSITVQSFRGLFYANPQRTSIASAAFSNVPGPVNATAAAGAGTFNPIMIVRHIAGTFFG